MFRAFAVSWGVGRLAATASCKPALDELGSARRRRVVAVVGEVGKQRTRWGTLGAAGAVGVGRQRRDVRAGDGEW